MDGNDPVARGAALDSLRYAQDVRVVGGRCMPRRRPSGAGARRGGSAKRAGTESSLSGTGEVQLAVAVKNGSSLVYWKNGLRPFFRTAAPFPPAKKRGFCRLRPTMPRRSNPTGCKSVAPQPGILVQCQVQGQEIRGLRQGTQLCADIVRAAPPARGHQSGEKYRTPRLRWKPEVTRTTWSCG